MRRRALSILAACFPASGLAVDLGAGSNLWAPADLLCGGGSLIAASPPDFTNAQVSSSWALCRSTDGGGWWIEWAYPFTEHSDSAQSIVVDASDPDTMYLLTAWHLFRSRDRGGSWEDLTSSMPVGLSSYTLTLLVAETASPAPLCLTACDGSSWESAFLSEDRGETCWPFEAAASASPVKAVAVDPGNDGPPLSTTEDGICETHDHGAGWNYLADGPGPGDLVPELELGRSPESPAGTADSEHLPGANRRPL